MEWNRRNIIGAIMILVLGFGSGAVIYSDQEGGVGFALFRLDKWADGLYGGTSSMTTEEERFAKRESERIRKTILVKIPSLRLEAKEVAPEQNGYLALYELTKDPDFKDLRSSGIIDQVSEEKIDPTVIRKDLIAFDAIGKEIERIAALTDRSNIINGKLHTEFLPAGEIKAMGDYLVLQARLAAQEGDEAESFRYLSLAVNLSEHLGSLESPYLLSETVYILLRLNVRSVFFKSIMPTLDRSTDLVKWQSILEPRTHVPQRFSVLVKGEFSTFTEVYMPILFEEVPDPEAMSMALAKYNDANAKRYEAMNFQQFSGAKVLPHEPFTKHISREGVGLFDIMFFGDDSWTRGAIRSVVVEHHYAAALDLLIREQKGEDISKLTETFLLNPQTLKPFVYDATTRTLDKVAVGTSGDIEALKLPW
ncbi:MAG: hypothetical protein V4727_14505 [Verrucomicrobiota bacterium]